MSAASAMAAAATAPHSHSTVPVRPGRMPSSVIALRISGLAAVMTAVVTVAVSSRTTGPR
ncbi:hypothetical protein ACIOMQ_28810 [Streptomyces sp. NPDC087845]|uniref:hypothetical protein n=1 Tax=Streptomyces sp. NPDC087845 TaxID=3365806 RepID=UPI00380B46CE